MSRSAVTDPDVIRTLARYERAVSRLLDVLRREPDWEPEAEPGSKSGDETDERADPPAPPIARRAVSALGRAVLPDPLTWPARPLDERCRWWTSRIGYVAALVPAAPRALGAVADRIPATALLGASVSGMAVLAIADEYGVTDQPGRVALLAAVLTDRAVDPPMVTAALGTPVRFDRRLGELVRLEEVRAARGPRRWWLVAAALRRLTGVLGDVEEVFDARPRGRLAARALGQLPAVGVLGGYLAERTAVQRAARRARRRLDRRR